MPFAIPEAATRDTPAYQHSSSTRREKRDVEVGGAADAGLEIEGGESGGERGEHEGWRGERDEERVVSEGAESEGVEGE